MINIYSLMKEKKKNLLTNSDHCNELIDGLCSMFSYQVESDTYLEKMLNHKLELWLRAFGKVGFAKDKDELYFGRCEFVGGHLNKYGWLDRVQIFTLDGKVSPTFNIESDDVVIMFNNTLGHGEWNALRYADKLTEIDKSWDCAVQNCRYSQLVLVKNDKVKANIDKAVESVKEGKPLIISGQDLIGNDLMTPNGSSKGVEVFNITDVANSDKLQYLTHASDDLTRTFYQKYGIDTNSTGKMAQQTTEEIEGSVGRSFIIPNDNYNWRVRALNEIKDKFGVEIKISWGESWGIELNKYEADANVDDTMTEELPAEDDKIKESEVPEDDKDRSEDQ